MPKQRFLAIQATPDLSNIRTAEISGVEHTVVPCIALCQGVLWPANAPGPELALAEEFGRIPVSWDGRPVVMNHPNVDGKPVSAGSISVQEEFGIGVINNTILDGDKLKMELWINSAKVESLGGIAEETVERLLNSDQTVEVSTGLFTVNEAVEGTYEGDEYTAIWRNIVPDHLALLSEGTIGACSVKGGCGAPRVNAGADANANADVTLKPVMQAVTFNVSTISAPVVNNEDCDCGGDSDCEDCAQRQQSMFGKLRAAMGKAADKWMFQFRDNVGLSDTDVREALRVALKQRTDDWFWIIAVFMEGSNSGNFIYEICCEGDLVSLEFTIAEDGSVSFGDFEPIEVRPVTTFVPVTVNAGVTLNDSTGKDNIMTKEDKVAGLIANEATNFKDADKAWLLGLEEAQLDSLEPVVAEVAEVAADAIAVAEAAKLAETAKLAANAEVDADVDADVTPVTLEGYLNGVPAEVADQVREGLALQKERKDHLIAGLTANKQNTFTAEELSGMDLKTLKSVAQLANVPDYSGDNVGQGTSRVNAEADADEAYTPAPSILSFKETPAVAAVA